MNTSNRSDSDSILTSTQIDDCNETPAISIPTSERRLRITVTLPKNDPNSLSETSVNPSFSYAFIQNVSCQTDFCKANKRKRSEIDSKVERFKYGETADASTLHRQAGVDTIKEKTENRSKKEKCDKNCDTVSTLASVEPQEFTNDNLGDKLVSRKKNKKTEQEQNKTQAFTTTEPIEPFRGLDMEDPPREEVSPIIETVEPPPVKCTPQNKNVVMESLHNNLSRPKRKLLKTFEQSWSENDKSEKSHSIHFSSGNGLIVNACYVDYNLIIVQELFVSLWSQSALGNILGAQHMWIPQGKVYRMMLENDCFLNESPETVISIENTCAYVELWTKEHMCDRPVADIFVVVYFWKLRPVESNKKMLQLENISGYANDVQYVVTRFSRNIIVSWNIVSDNNKTTLIRCYQLAADYRTVASIKEIQSVNHYVSSLHTIEDCEGLIMGCGDHKLTLWNLEYGYILTTIDFHEVGPQRNSLWATCDRGFLFTIQHFQGGSLQLIAINGINYTWKKLQSYNSPNGYHNLQGACIDNGLLVAFYDNGVLCWNVQTSEIIFEEASTETVYMPSGKHVIMMSNDQINVKHAVGYLVTSDET